MSWRGRIASTVLGVVGVLVAAWVWMPDFRDGIGVLWGDLSSQAGPRR
jgi:hypothetical protein